MSNNVGANNYRRAQRKLLTIDRVSFKNDVSFVLPVRATFFDRLIFALMESSKKRTSGSSELSTRSTTKLWNICVSSNAAMKSELSFGRFKLVRKSDERNSIPSR